MDVDGFIQWLSVGGVAIAGVLITANKDKKSNENILIDQLQEELKYRDDRIDLIVARLDSLEDDNAKLKEINYKLQLERDSALREKDKVEQQLLMKISELEKENRELKARVSELEKVNKRIASRQV